MSLKRVIYRLAQNHGKWVMSISSSILSSLKEIASSIPSTNSFLFQEICTAAPPYQGKVLRSLYP